MKILLTLFSIVSILLRFGESRRPGLCINSPTPECIVKEGSDIDADLEIKSLLMYLDIISVMENMYGEDDDDDTPRSVTVDAAAQVWMPNENDENDDEPTEDWQFSILVTGANATLSIMGDQTSILFEGSVKSDSEEKVDMELKVDGFRGRFDTELKLTRTFLYDGGRG